MRVSDCQVDIDDMDTQANPTEVFNEWIAQFKKSYAEDIEVCFFKWSELSMTPMHAIALGLIMAIEETHRMCAQEHALRFAVWLDNLKFIVEYNSGVTSHWVR